MDFSYPKLKHEYKSQEVSSKRSGDLLKCISPTFITENDL